VIVAILSTSTQSTDVEDCASLSGALMDVGRKTIDACDWSVSLMAERADKIK
jgi:hypothetical protein